MTPGAEAQPTFRAARPSDMAYIFSSWTKSYFDWLKPQPHYSLFLKLFKPVSAKLAERSEILIACDPSDEDTILGFVVYERAATPILHFVKVKGALEGHGIAKALLQAAGIVRGAPCIYTFASPKTKAPGWTYVPFQLIPAELIRK